MAEETSQNKVHSSSPTLKGEVEFCYSIMVKVYLCI